MSKAAKKKGKAKKGGKKAKKKEGECFSPHEVSWRSCVRLLN